MFRHYLALITSTIRGLTLDHLRVLALYGLAGFGALWLLYVIISASVYPSLENEPVAEAELLPKFEYAQMPKPGPQVPFTDADGNVLTLGAKKGKVLLVNFWATWCAPCLEEMPTLDRLQAELGGPRFEVVAINLNREGMSEAVSYLERNNITQLAAYNEKGFKFPRAIEVNGLPVTLLIDRNGLEIGRLIGPEEWDSREAKAFLNRYIER